MGEVRFSRVNQVGIVVRDAERVAKVLSEKYGIGPFGFIEVPHASARLKIGLVDLGGIQVELIQVLEGESIHSRFLERKGEGIHHLGFFVKDINKAVKGFEERGVRVLEGGEILGVKYAYLDTEGELGFVTELIQV